MEGENANRPINSNVNKKLFKLLSERYYTPHPPHTYLALFCHYDFCN